ncbi:MAG: TonB family protein [Alphaproteobacteria bacterium]|nr:TonB family protein [Alphaproteobacteria bacterium]MCB9792926.1 TonB family protein [Alphaproteobacteria bacterium]
MFTPPSRHVPRHRKAGAAMMALLLPMTLGGAALLAGTQAVVIVPEEAPIEVVFPELSRPGPLMGPPGSPEEAPAAGDPDPAPPILEDAPVPPVDDGAAEDPESTEVTENDTPQVSLLSSALSAALSTGGGGGGGGCEGPDCGGGGGGCVGPDCGGGGGGGGYGEVDWTQVKVRFQVEPRMPAAARSLGHGEYSCRLRFFVDERGRPADVKVEACPQVFQESALSAARGWRFAPMRIEGQPTPAQFVLTIRYRVD